MGESAAWALRRQRDTGFNRSINGLAVTIAGESLVASCNRALYWPSRRTVFVADLHLGKAASFRARSIPLPHGTTEALFGRLDELLLECEADNLVVLGDLWHDRLGRTDGYLDRLSAWTKTHPNVRFTLVSGNHDWRAGNTPRSTGFVETDDMVLGPFMCRHHPIPDETSYVLCGHIHPGISLGAAKTSLTVPCFHFGQRIGVLPAFGEFTGLAPISPETEEDLVLALAEGQVFSLKGKRLAPVSASLC